MEHNKMDDSRPYQVALTPMLKRIHLISRRNGYMQKVREAYEEILREQEQERRQQIAQQKQAELQKALEKAAAAALAGTPTGHRKKSVDLCPACSSCEPRPKRARHSLGLCETVLGDGLHMEVAGKPFAAEPIKKNCNGL